jgi:2-C-methyl-D-erythritol 4-phosphate cytidylyltransferase
VGVVIVAAGEGRRFGGDAPKQFLPVAGIPMLLRALRPFTSHPDVRQVIVVLPRDHVDSPPAWLGELAGGNLELTPGGPERMDSVENGLARLGEECGIVLVHDAARPLVRRETIDGVIAGARHGSGAIAAVPVSDTLKQSGTDGDRSRIVRTLPREGVWRAQTPQGFPRAMLEAAYAEARKNQASATDEAALVERLGYEVVLVPDSSWNIKVTTPEDLSLAELIAARERA